MGLHLATDAVAQSESHSQMVNDTQYSRQLWGIEV